MPRRRERAVAARVTARVAMALASAARRLLQRGPSREQRRFNALQAELAPQMHDVRRLGFEFHPYLFRRARGGFRSATLSTDGHGFRRSGGGDGDCVAFAAAAGPRGVLNGNSIAFGMGASADERTIAGCLDAGRAGGCRWYNYAMLGAATLQQERAVADLYAPLDADHYVTVSGCIDVFLASTGRAGRPSSPPFFGQDWYEALLGVTPGAARSDPQRCFEALLERLRREVVLLARRWNGRALYCLQPIAAWVDKAESPQEQALLDAFHAIPGDIGRGYHPDAIARFHEPLRATLEEVCRGAGIGFVDLNREPGIRAAGWVFLDPVHLTDLGCRVVADAIASRLEDGRPGPAGG